MGILILNLLWSVTHSWNYVPIKKKTMKHPKNPARIRRNISTGRVGERERERRGPYWQRTLQSSELDSTIRKIRLILGLLSNSQQSQPSREVTIRSIQTIQYSIILSFFLYLSFFLAHGGSPNTFGLSLLVPFFLSNCTLPSLSPSYTSIQQLLHFLVINKKIIH